MNNEIMKDIFISYKTGGIGSNFGSRLSQKLESLGYICLTRLIPEFLDMVDERKMALTPAVEISKLSKAVQQKLYDFCIFISCY